MKELCTTQKGDENDVVRWPGSEVRETIHVLPMFMQLLLTWLTGKPLRGQHTL